jgi:uncharacterized protein YciI
MLSTGSTPQEETVITEHFSYLQRLTEEGVVLLCGRTMTADYSSFGIVIFRADSEDAAQKIMEDDPAVKQRVVRAELFPFRIALLSKALSVEVGS